MSRLFISVKELMILENKSSIKSASRAMLSYFGQLKKKPKERNNALTISEYARVKGISEDDVIKAIQR